MQRVITAKLSGDETNVAGRPSPGQTLHPNTKVIYPDLGVDVIRIVFVQHALHS